MDDDALIQVLECAESYIQSQEKLASHLSSGLLQLALARRDNRSVCSLDDIRFELDETCLLDCLEDKIELSVKEGDDIQLFCGLPPPALRKAKVQFRLALEEILLMANNVQDIMTISVNVSPEEDI